MRYLIALGAVALTITGVYAHPSSQSDEAQRQKGCPFADSQVEKRALGGLVYPRIDVTGDHAFIPPNFENGDVRGPCPGLNVLANHGYLPRNGWASYAQSVDAANRILGMGLDLTKFLTQIAVVYDGNPISANPGYSIGGPIRNGQGNNLFGLLGKPMGISFSHNRFETDASPTRGDFYQHGGDAYSLQMENFLGLYNLHQVESNPNYDRQTLFEHRKNRYAQSVAQNGDFLFGPFLGIVVADATYNFIYAMFSNFTAETPDGFLSKDALKSFLAISGTEGSFTYNRGHERMPENWFRRALGTEYGMPRLYQDLAAMIQYDPTVLNIGGNTGTPNSFVGVNVSDLTGGSIQTLTPENAMCLAYQSGQQFAPDFVAGSVAAPLVPIALAKLNNVFDPIISNLGCPRLAAFDKSVWEKYPGFTKG